MTIDKKDYAEEKKKEIDKLINKIDERLKERTNSLEDVTELTKFMTQFYPVLSIFII